MNLTNLVLHQEEVSNQDVVELLSSHDTLTKKISTIYLEQECNANEDLCLLAANLILRDCSDANPAVRSSCVSIVVHLHGLEETAVKIISNALCDQSPMVRRSAALACMKLSNISPDTLMTSNLVDLLYDGIRDNDPYVATNCLVTLEEILLKEGGVVINKQIAHYLLGKLPDLPLSNISPFITLLHKYEPQSEEELFHILNLLDDSLHTLSPSALISVMKLFVSYTKSYPDLVQDLLETTKPSIHKILNRCISEINYLLLQYLAQFKELLKIVFSQNFKPLLLRSKDPYYLKIQKLKILPFITGEENIMEVLHEIKPYCSDYLCHSHAIDSITCISLLNSDFNELVLQILIPLLTAPSEYVVSSSLKSLLLISFPLPPPQPLINAVIKALCQSSIQNNQPKIILHVLSSMCDYIPDVAYIIEQIANRSATLCEEDHCLLLNTSCWIFYHRPGEMQSILSNILSDAFCSTNNIIKNRAALIYSILNHKSENAKMLVKPCFLPNDKEASLQAHS